MHGDFSKILDVEPPQDPAIPLLSIQSKELKAETRTDICALVFTKAAFVTNTRWKQSNCPLTEKLINKIWYIHRIEYYPNSKGRKF